MSGRFLLDTNIVIAIFAKEAKVQAHLVSATEVFVPAIVLNQNAKDWYKCVFTDHSK